MNEKYSLQYLIESLSQTTGESKKVAEQFSKAFFDTIVEALYMGETSIKIKGLGTFKLVEVDSRESVNVSNGERIVIPSYKKVSFVPDEEIAERLTQKKKQAEETQSTDNEEDAGVEAQEEVTENVEENVTEDVAEKVTEEVAKEVEEVVAETPAAVAVVETEAATVVEPEEDDAIDELIAPEEMSRVEQPSSALDGIDLLISTPESLDELKSQYEEAKQKAEAAIAAAKQANTEKMRLERMLERLQAHTQPEAIEETVDPEQPEAIEEPVEPEPEPEPEPEIKEEEEKEEEEKVEEEAKEEFVPEQNVIMVKSHDDEDADDDTDDDDEGDEHLPWIRRHKWLAAAISVLVCGGILFAINALHSADMKVAVAEVVDDTNASRNKTYAKAIADSIRLQNQRNLQAVAPVLTDSMMLAQKESAPVQTDTTVAQKKSEPAKDERAVPPHCFLKKGESLTILSVRYYGTKDSVPAIIRINQFRDPNNVPIGAKVFLP